jgi:hypothetical protein
MPNQAIMSRNVQLFAVRRKTPWFDGYPPRAPASAPPIFDSSTYSLLTPFFRVFHTGQIWCHL